MSPGQSCEAEPTDPKSPGMPKRVLRSPISKYLWLKGGWPKELPRGPPRAHAQPPISPGCASLVVLKTVLILYFAPLPRGVPGERPDCHFPEEIGGFVLVPARTRGG